LHSPCTSTSHSPCAQHTLAFGRCSQLQLRCVYALHTCLHVHVLQGGHLQEQPALAERCFSDAGLAGGGRVVAEARFRKLPLPLSAAVDWGGDARARHDIRCHRARSLASERRCKGRGSCLHGVRRASGMRSYGACVAIHVPRLFRRPLTQDVLRSVRSVWCDCAACQLPWAQDARMSALLRWHDRSGVVQCVVGPQTRLVRIYNIFVRISENPNPGSELPSGRCPEGRPWIS
jgi:hypothetical protein